MNYRRSTTGISRRMSIAPRVALADPEVTTLNTA